MELDINRLCLKCMKPSVENGFCKSCGTGVGFVQKPEYALPAGTILAGRYLVGAVLGFGGFGITYIGLDLELQQRVALKEFMPVPANMAERAPGKLTVTARKNFSYGLERFYEEARVVHRYRSHPNIIHVYKLFRENNTAYYAMEYLEGHDLAGEYRRSGGQMEYEALLPVVLPVMDALEYVHRDHLIHRDISPDNIYVGKTVKLIDFGAARMAIAGKSNSLTIIHKKGFTPEEQYRTHGQQGPWTDIYALASTMYVCLSGHMVPEALERMQHDGLRDVRFWGARMPDCAAEAIMHALAVKAENRQRTVGEFRGELLGKQSRISSTVSPIDTFLLQGIQGDYAGSGIREKKLVIGRDASVCQLVYPWDTPGISRKHCTFWIDSRMNVVFVRDENTTFGTWVNGRRLLRGEECVLTPGDRISFGMNQTFQIDY